MADPTLYIQQARQDLVEMERAANGLGLYSLQTRLEAARVDLDTALLLMSPTPESGEEVPF